MDKIKSFIDKFDSVWGGIILLVFGILVFFIPVLLQWVVGVTLVYIGVKTITRKQS